MKTFKKLIAAALALSMILSSAAVLAVAEFSDIEAGSVVEEAVSNLVEKGIISGYPDGTFKPDGVITRAEFAAVITRFKGIAASEDVVTGFTDLDQEAASAWARPYVKAAVDAGIINGYPDGTFGAGESVTYEQAIKMLVCALDYQALAEEELAKLGDGASWSAGYIAVAENKGITANATSADVTAPATRGIVAILTGNALSGGAAAAPAADYSMSAADVEAKRAEINAKKELRVLSLGSSYIDDSFKYLAAIAAADGIEAYTVNMYKGGGTLKQQWERMNGLEVYPTRREYLPDSTTIKTENVSFDDGLATNGGGWDYVTMHQRSVNAPFFEKWYTEETPYVTDIADYVRENSPGTEVLFFETWATYADGMAEAYPTLVEGIKTDKHYETIFGVIRENYLKAAELIGNPNRIIPAGEAVFMAVTKYGIPQYEDNANTEDATFKSTARAMYIDKESHMTYSHGRVLAALTWYEYLTGNDVRSNTYQNEYVSASDMALLKEIAHEACSLPEYNPAN